MSFCAKCGKNLDADSSFCISCGAPVSPAQKAAPSVATAQPTPQALPTLRLADTGRNTFVNSYLGLVVVGSMIFIWLVLGMAATPMFAMSQNFGNIFTVGICLLGPIGFATALTTRAKGPDFSIGSMMALSAALIGVVDSSTGSPVLGIFLALMVCAVFGLLNGVIITFLRVPAVLVTIVMGVIARGLTILFLNGMTLPASPTITGIAAFRLGSFSLGGLLILALTFAAAFLLVLFTKLGKPTYARDNKPALSTLFAYMASAMIAAVAGLFMMSRLAAASPIAGSGYEPFILAVFACVAGSRAMDNRTMPVVIALAPVLLFALINNAMSIMGAGSDVQMITTGMIAIVLVAVAFLSRRLSPSYNGD